jgi:hypothetical protein
MQKDKFQKNKGDNNRPNMVNYNLHTPSMWYILFWKPTIVSKCSWL